MRGSAGAFLLVGMACASFAEARARLAGLPCARESTGKGILSVGLRAGGLPRVVLLRGAFRPGGGRLTGGRRGGSVDTGLQHVPDEGRERLQLGQGGPARDEVRNKQRGAVPEARLEASGFFLLQPSPSTPCSLRAPSCAAAALPGSGGPRVRVGGRCWRAGVGLLSALAAW